MSKFNFYHTEGVYFIMNKTILFCAVFALSALNLSALDITTTDGKVYKNVEITNILPDAIGFMYTKKDFTYVLRDVKMTLLTKDLQKKFNYSPQKAKKFQAQVNKFQGARARLEQKHHKEDLALFREHKKTSKELDHIKALLYAHRIECWVHILRVVGQDCLARVTKPYSSSKFGYLGKMYIRNLAGSQNALIGTTIYPTGETKSLQEGMFPVYDANLTKLALEILKKHENSPRGSGSIPALIPGKDVVFPVNAPKKK